MQSRLENRMGTVLLISDHRLYGVYIDTNKNSNAHVLASSVLWFLLFPIMNSFNKTEAAIIPMQALLPGEFPIYSNS